MVQERFRREAWAAASLRSPHTIELYDFGVANDGTLYFAMELLEGIDLQQLVDEFGPQPPGRVIHILRQACLSLAEAHDRGLVHRDIKPSNLMLCRMGPQVDFLKVLDFGLVKTDGPAADTQLTAPDVTAGTPAYLPPEALDGVATLGHHADLYALGCVAYWLLAGRPVFTGSSAIQVLLKHGRETPGPMIGSRGPVPGDLEALVRQCLEKQPDARPRNALTLERALAACGAAADWTADDGLEWWARYRPGAKGASEFQPAG
jgi:serine/threonine-protein kinase